MRLLDSKYSQEAVNDSASACQRDSPAPFDATRSAAAATTNNVKVSTPFLCPMEAER